METILLVFIIVILCAIIYIIYTNFKTNDRLHNIQQHLISLSHVVNTLPSHMQQANHMNHPSSAAAENDNLRKEVLSKFEEQMGKMFNTINQEGEYADDDYNTSNGLPANMNMFNNGFIITKVEEDGNAEAEIANGGGQIMEIDGDGVADEDADGEECGDSCKTECPIDAEAVEDIDDEDMQNSEYEVGMTTDVSNAPTEDIQTVEIDVVVDDMDNIDNMDDIGEDTGDDGDDDGDSISGITLDVETTHHGQKQNDITESLMNPLEQLNNMLKTQFENDDFNFSSDEEDAAQFDIDDETATHAGETDETSHMDINTAPNASTDADTNMNTNEQTNNGVDADEKKMINYELLNIKELRQIAKNMNLSTKGGKTELVERLKSQATH